MARTFLASDKERGQKLPFHVSTRVNDSSCTFCEIVTLREKRVPKRCPWGTIATNGTLFSKGHSVFLNNHVYEKKSTPKDTILRTVK